MVVFAVRNVQILRVLAVSRSTQGPSTASTLSTWGTFARKNCTSLPGTRSICVDDVLLSKRKRRPIGFWRWWFKSETTPMRWWLSLHSREPRQIACLWQVWPVYIVIFIYQVHTNHLSRRYIFPWKRYRNIVPSPWYLLYGRRGYKLSRRWTSGFVHGNCKHSRRENCLPLYFASECRNW